MSASKRQEQYEGSVVQVGNSRGMRLPAGFFNAHPEFNGKVRLTVVADGQVLMSTMAPAQGKGKRDDEDPVLASFLKFLEKQMLENPDQIVAADAAQLRRIGKLVKGIRVE